MPRFEILPADISFPTAEITSPNAAGVLLLVQRLDCKEADVMRDGEYSFSIRLGKNGLWCIYQRGERGANVPPLARLSFTSRSGCPELIGPR